MGKPPAKHPEPGDAFGRLTVLEEVPPAGPANGHRYYRCECRCGADTVTTSQALRTKGTRSCGCLRRDQKRLGALRRLQTRLGVQLASFAPLEPADEALGAYRAALPALERLHEAVEAELRS